MSALLVCERADTIPGVPAAERWCNGCGTGVWVSHSMLWHADNGRVNPICLLCAHGSMVLTGREAAIHPDQVDELRQAGVLDFAREAVAELNREARRRHGHDRRRTSG